MRLRDALLSAGALVALLADPAAAEDPLGPPSGTLRIETRSVAAGIGVTWGDGVLEVDGVEHAFSVSGLSVVDVGVSRVTAVGRVWGLGKLEDFNGTYTGVDLGAAVGGGESFVAMRNQNGVYIKLRAVQQGVGLRLATKGTTLTLQ